MPDPATDRNLLFGILALQMDFISRDALVAAMNAWVLDKAKPLGQVLRDQGVLSADRLALLDALLQEHLKQHGNDPERSLAALSSVGSARRDLQQVADAGVQASLAHVSAARQDDDPYATRASTVGAPTGSGLRYSILRPHAKGGLGEVYVARDEELRREVALKEIQDKHADHPESRTRFLLEAEVTGGLEHPGIVPVYGLGTYGDGRPFYAMRFIRGDSLKHALDAFHKAKKDLPAGERLLRLRQLLRRFIDVCNAIAYAHSRGVLHRDLKPGNVMLGKYGETLVVDWGLAKPLGRAEEVSAEGPLQPSLSGDSGMTQAGTALGTPAYMSPEQAAGRLDQLGPASDVYSLGATLYHLLTGQAPFPTGHMGEVLDRVQRGDYPRPRSLDPRIPAALEAVCRKAMALQPADRYASPQGLAEDLEKWLADEPVAAYREPLVARLARWRRRHPTLVTASALVLLTLAGAAVAGRVVVGREQDRARALAEADAVEEASPAAVPAILQDLVRHRTDVEPRLRVRWQDAALPDGRRLRLGLALAEDAEVRARLVALAGRAEDPPEVLLARDALAPHAAEAAPLLWAGVEQPSTPAAERFRLLVILATLAPEDGRWAGRAGEVVSGLVHENLLRLPAWVEALRPVRDRLVPPLASVFRDAGRPEAERGLATTLLADYAADRPEVLADLLMDADPKAFSVLLPLLERHRERALGVLTAELDRTAAWDWKDAPLDPAWAAPDPALVRQVEAAGGLVAERFALCQALPLDQFDAVAAALRRAGYRPTRLRPYAVSARQEGASARGTALQSRPVQADGSGEPSHKQKPLTGVIATASPPAAAVLVAAVWARDGRDCRAAHGLTAQEVRRQDGEHRKEGYQPADVAGYLEGGRERYAALWVKGEKGEEARLYVGVPEVRHQAEGWGPMRAAKLQPATLHVLVGADGAARYSSVWRKSSMAGTSFWGDDEGTHADRGLSDGLPVDVALYDNPQYVEDARAEAVAWLSGPPWAGLYLRSQHPLLPHPERHYAGCFQASAAFDYAVALGRTPEEQLRRCGELAGQGYRPAALSAAVVGAGGQVVTASVWHRPVVPDEAKERLAKRQASAAAALLRLGQRERVWPLLQHRPDPRLRSYLIHWLSPLRADAGALVRRLAEEPDVSAKRALLLCLGEFAPEQLPAAERDAVMPAVVALYRDDPDPGLHGAAEWLLRQWQQGDRLREIDKELATGKIGGQRRWYVNGQGQTFVVVPGPVEFLMGSPRTEVGRFGGAEQSNETQHRRRIGRTFALATKEVTVEQFLRFRREDQYHKPYSPTPAHPANTVTWYDAAAYCNWLSEQENIPPDQWCYVPNSQGQYAEGMGMRPGYLSLTGYRLPTEAEWEYACRAGAVTSRYYGEGKELLGKYACYTKTSQDKEMLPAGSLKPNDLGLFDMLGNTWEWCQETGSEYPHGSHGEPVVDDERRLNRNTLQLVTDRDRRSLRGGSFLDMADYVRSATRMYHWAAYRNGNYGFRPARTFR